MPTTETAAVTMLRRLTVVNQARKLAFAALQAADADYVAARARLEEARNEHFRTLEDCERVANECGELIGACHHDLPRGHVTAARATTPARSFT